MTCRSATALTALPTPRTPCVRTIPQNVAIVPGTPLPAAAVLLRVTSAVFMHVVTPMARYACAAAWSATALKGCLFSRGRRGGVVGLGKRLAVWVEAHVGFDVFEGLAQAGDWVWEDGQHDVFGSPKRAGSGLT